MNHHNRMIQKRAIGKSKMLALVILVVQFLGAIALEYSDLEALGIACKGRDSCQDMTDPEDFSKRNCECDSHCTVYGDCCFDAPSADPDNYGFQECMPFGTVPYQGAYVVSSCPNGDGSNAAACMENNMSDPFLATPVSTPEGATYRNAYCAECNGADLDNLVAWLPLINCETLVPYNLSIDFVYDGLERAADKDDEWGVWFENEFHKCDVLFDKPESVNNLRFCRAPVVSTCPDNYRRNSVRQQCEAYTAVVYTAEAAYKNPHCAICNSVPVDMLLCDHIGQLARIPLAYWLQFAFDYYRTKGTLWKHLETRCRGEDMFYDTFSKRCRPFSCGRRQKKVKQKCVNKS